MTEQTIIMAGQRTQFDFRPVGHDALIARVETLTRENLDRYVAERNLTPVDEKVDVTLIDWIEYQAVYDEFGEPVLDKDGQVVEDYSKPVTRWALVAERACYEGMVAHA